MTTHVSNVSDYILVIKSLDAAEFGVRITVNSEAPPVCTGVPALQSAGTVRSAPGTSRIGNCAAIRDSRATKTPIFFALANIALQGW